MTTNRKKVEYDDLIASYLWGDISSDGERKLLELEGKDSMFSEELKMHRRVDELLDLVFNVDTNIKKHSIGSLDNGIQKATSKSFELDNIRNISSPSGLVSRSVWKKLSIAAVILFSIGGIWFNYSQNLKDHIGTLSYRTYSSPEIKRSSFLVLYAFGSVIVDGKVVKDGDVIDDFQSLHVGKDSFCDLQIRDKNMTAVLRLYANTDYSNRIAKDEGIKKYYTAIDQGRALFRVDKLNANDQFEVFMPDFSAKVVGTQFYMETGQDGNLGIDVVEGRVRVDLHLTSTLKQIISSPGEYQNIHTVLTKTNELERILSAGQMISVEQSILKQRVNQIRLGIQNKNGKKSYIKGKGKIVQFFVEKGIDNHKLRALKAELAELKSIDGINVMKKSSELSAILKKRNLAMEELFFRRIEVILNKRIETLLLKNGKEIKGIILQIGNQYRIFTPFSVETVNVLDVKEIKF